MSESGNVKRRDFLKGVGAASAASSLSANPAAAQNDGDDRTAGKLDGSATIDIKLKINGQSKSLTIDPRTTLVDLLRENQGMMGTKKGCDHGSCGACTVHVNGQRVLSCLTLAATIDGAEVQTIEGLAGGQQLHPLQEAFLRCDAYQCGYCTPGQIMSGVACIAEGHAEKSPEEAREWMSGNLCRCSAYPNILAAVRQTAGADPIKDPVTDSITIH